MDTVKIDARDVHFWYGDFHALKGISTVSYTHLDVYKRQAYQSAMSASWSASR